jgi:hypothetical protein
VIHPISHVIQESSKSVVLYCAGERANTITEEISGVVEGGILFEGKFLIHIANRLF